MKTINVNFNNGDNFITRINGTLIEIAQYYFSTSQNGKEVASIDILDAGEEVFENEYVKNTPTKLYLASAEDIKEFDLQHNIRKEYKVEYKIPGYEDCTSSCGFMNIQRCNFC